MRKTKTIIWTDEKIKETALKHHNRRDFAINDNCAYGAAWKKGKEYLDIICSHMLPMRKTWSKDRVLEVGTECDNQQELRRLYYGAYKYAYRNNIMNEISFKEKKKVVKWSNGELLEKALTCDTKSEFERKFLGMYKAILKRGLSDQAFAHTKKDIGCSYPEKEVFGFIKEFFPNCKKLRLRNISIFEKPWIYGFDIDILVPDLMKGIEFDGKYHHSFERMKITKKNWPEEDIRNYHQIKDDYFLSKGIRIIHVKEEDWKLNKEECKVNILRFLNGHI